MSTATPTHDEVWWRRRLAQMSPAARQALRQKLRHPTVESWIAERRPAHTPTPAHLKRLCEALTRAITVGGSRIIVSMPPRHAKSETILSALAWAIERAPHRLNAYVTYSQTKAVAKSRKVRQLVEEGTIPLNWQSYAAHDWRTTLGGGLVANGVAGGLTGEGITGLLVVDDPLKNRREAESQKKRDELWDWFTDVAVTRMQPGASVVVVMTRWHDDDVVGRLKKSIDSGDTRFDDWQVIEMPAVRQGPTLEGDDLLPADTGYALWPERYSLRWLKRVRAFGEYMFSSLYQQRPIPRGGRVFRDPARYSSRPAVFDHVVLALDPAGTQSTRADRSAMVALGIDYVHDPAYDAPLPRAWVLEVETMQETPDVVAERALAFQRRHGGAPMYIESSRDGKAVRKALSSMQSGAGIEFRFVVPLGDKFTRAQPVAAAWNNGRVLVPLDAPWLTDFLHVVSKFTGAGDARDDEVDSLSHGFNAALRLPASVSGSRTARDRGEREPSTEGAFPVRERASRSGRSAVFG